MPRPRHLELPPALALVDPQLFPASARFLPTRVWSDAAVASATQATAMHHSVRLPAEQFDSLICALPAYKQRCVVSRFLTPGNAAGVTVHAPGYVTTTPAFFISFTTA